MAKIFNVNGVCLPERHYMVDLTSRLEAIKNMVDIGNYFTINRGGIKEIVLGDKLLIEAVV